VRIARSVTVMPSTRALRALLPPGLFPAHLSSAIPFVANLLQLVDGPARLPARPACARSAPIPRASTASWAPPIAGRPVTRAGELGLIQQHHCGVGGGCLALFPARASIHVAPLDSPPFHRVQAGLLSAWQPSPSIPTYIPTPGDDNSPHARVACGLGKERMQRHAESSMSREMHEARNE